MPKAIRIYEHGGPSVMKWEEYDPGKARSGEALVRHTAVGLNFTDVYARKGFYPAPVPGGLGVEAAGIVEAIGRNVRSVKVGDRVVYFTPVPGTYCEYAVAKAAMLVRLPRDIDDETAAAAFTKGTTAWFLLRETYKVGKDDTILLHAAAGGLGLIASQWANDLGARVIGVVSTPQKARLAKRNGCHSTILSSEDIPEKVRRLTKGQGVDVVYDSVGRDTFEASLASLRPRGLLVCFGNASGPPPEFSPMQLMMHGSLYLTRCSGADYIGTPESLQKAAGALFSLIRRGIVDIHIGQRFALKDAAKAHRALEGRKTVGSSLLLP